MLPSPNFLLRHQVFLYCAVVSGRLYPAPSKEQLHRAYFLSQTPKSVAVGTISAAIKCAPCLAETCAHTAPQGIYSVMTLKTQKKTKSLGVWVVSSDCDSLYSFEITTGPLRMSSNNNLHQYGASLEFIKQNLMHMDLIPSNVRNKVVDYNKSGMTTNV